MPLSLEGLTEDEIAHRFDRRHDELYGFSLPEHTHEVLAVRASAVGPIPEPDRLVPRRLFEGQRRARRAAVRMATRPVWDDRAAAFVDGQIFRWDDLRPADRLTGPLDRRGDGLDRWIPSDAVASSAKRATSSLARTIQASMTRARPRASVRAFRPCAGSRAGGAGRPRSRSGRSRQGHPRRRRGRRRRARARPRSVVPDASRSGAGARRQARGAARAENRARLARPSP